MDYVITISDSKKYIIVTLFTDVTIKIADEIALKTEEIGKENKINRMLYDVRKAKNIEQIKPNYQFAFTNFPNPEDHFFQKVANLEAPHDDSHNSVIAFMKERGFNIKQFKKEEKALEWLERDFYIE